MRCEAGSTSSSSLKMQMRNVEFVHASLACMWLKAVWN